MTPEVLSHDLPRETNPINTRERSRLRKLGVMTATLKGKSIEDYLNEGFEIRMVPGISKEILERPSLKGDIAFGVKTLIPELVTADDFRKYTLWLPASSSLSLKHQDQKNREYGINIRHKSKIPSLRGITGEAQDYIALAIEYEIETGEPFCFAGIRDKRKRRFFDTFRASRSATVERSGKALHVTYDPISIWRHDAGETGLMLIEASPLLIKN